MPNALCVPGDGEGEGSSSDEEELFAAGGGGAEPALQPVSRHDPGCLFDVVCLKTPRHEQEPQQQPAGADEKESDDGAADEEEQEEQDEEVSAEAAGKDKMWAEMSAEEQQAIRELGLTQATWDDPPESGAPPNQSPWP